MNQLLNQLDKLDTLECEGEKDIIEAFIERYQVSYEEAKEIFDETKKWLWLAAQDDNEQPLFIDKPLLIIDEMWHNFILHTRLYANFCLKHFRKFIHHKPTSAQEKKANEQAMLDNPRQILDEHKERVEKQYGLIYDKLGAETLLRWYDWIAQKYTPEYIESIKKA